MRRAGQSIIIGSLVLTSILAPAPAVRAQADANAATERVPSDADERTTQPTRTEASSAKDFQTALDQARYLIDQRDGKGAIAILEPFIANPPVDRRDDLKKILRSAYSKAIEQAVAAGSKDEAREYREILAILNRVPKRKRNPADAQADLKPGPDRSNPLADDKHASNTAKNVDIKNQSDIDPVDLPRNVKIGKDEAFAIRKKSPSNSQVDLHSGDSGDRRAGVDDRTLAASDPAARVDPRNQGMPAAALDPNLSGDRALAVSTPPRSIVDTINASPTIESIKKSKRPQSNSSSPANPDPNATPAESPGHDSAFGRLIDPPDKPPVSEFLNPVEPDPRRGGGNVGRSKRIADPSASTSASVPKSGLADESDRGKSPSDEAFRSKATTDDAVRKVAVNSVNSSNAIPVPNGRSAKTQGESAEAPHGEFGFDPRVRDADFAFEKKRYIEAGAIYSKLAKSGELPPDRVDHWCYCRCYVVAEKINAKPKTKAEWDALRAEVKEIRAVVSPKAAYLVRYLDKSIDEKLPRKYRDDKRLRLFKGSKGSVEETRFEVKTPSGGSATRSGEAATVDRAVVRAGNDAAKADPDFTPAHTIYRRAKADDRAREDDVAQSASPNVGGNADPTAAVVYETAHFRVTHIDKKKAESAAKIAEAIRDREARLWFGEKGMKAAWSVKCEIRFHPDEKSMCQATGCPAGSPGFSTIGLDDGGIVARRIDLRADHPRLLDAIIPHEVAHLVAAEIGTEEPIATWVDEGIAVLAEPPSDQRDRDAIVAQAIAHGPIFNIKTLMTAQYPRDEHWKLFVAQSGSVVRYLVSIGTRAKFAAFVRDGAKSGYESALKRYYSISGYDDLRARWIADFNRRSAAEIAKERSVDRDRRIK